MRRLHYEDAPEYAARAYQVRGFDGIAFRVVGWETQPDDDTEWTGYEVRTGSLVAIMVGDDRTWRVEPEDISPLKPSEYCLECGQIGCAHGAREDSDGN